MRVLIVSQYYPPESVPIPAALARALADEGHAVRVLTGYPNYPLGRIFRGYKQRWRSREKDGRVETLRVPLFPSHSTNSLARILNYVSFALTSTSARGYASGADVVYVYATQMTAALGPWVWRIAGAAPYVLHVQDLWPDSITGSSIGRGGMLALTANALLTPWLRSVYRRSSGVVAIAPAMASTLVDRGVSPDKIQVIYNWSDSEPSGDVVVGPSVETSRVRLVYAGNVGDMQDLVTVVRAVARLAADGVTLQIVGDGVALEAVRREVEASGRANIVLTGRVPSAQMDAIYGRADFALVTLRDLPAFAGTIPSKFQAALAHGVPVITTVRGDVENMVREHGLGFTAEPESADSLVGALREALSQSRADYALMSKRARSTYQQKFSKSAGTAQLTTTLAAATQNRR